MTPVQAKPPVVQISEAAILYPGESKKLLDMSGQLVVSRVKHETNTVIKHLFEEVECGMVGVTSINIVNDGSSPAKPYVEARFAKVILPEESPLVARYACSTTMGIRDAAQILGPPAQCEARHPFRVTLPIDNEVSGWIERNYSWHSLVNQWRQGHSLNLAPEEKTPGNPLSFTRWNEEVGRGYFNTRSIQVDSNPTRKVAQVNPLYSQESIASLVYSLALIVRFPDGVDRLIGFYGLMPKEYKFIGLHEAATFNTDGESVVQKNLYLEDAVFYALKIVVVELPIPMDEAKDLWADDLIF